MDPYQEQVDQCADELMEALPDLAERHQPMTLIAALAEHVGGALAICRAENTCSDAMAHRIVDRIHEICFPDPTETCESQS